MACIDCNYCAEVGCTNSGYYVCKKSDTIAHGYRKLDNIDITPDNCPLNEKSVDAILTIMKTE